MNTLTTMSLRDWQLPAALGLLLVTPLVMAVQPQNTPAQFDINGHIESFTLDVCPGPPSALNDPTNYKLIPPANALNCTATIVVNGQSITVPSNTVITYPATFLTPYESFAWNPLCTSSTCTETGLAIKDTKRLPNNANPATYEASIQGNVVYDSALGAPGLPKYIAGLVAISQQDLNSSEGFVNFIDYATGEFRVGGDIGVANGARIRLNDPVGRFGRSTGPKGVSPDTQDVRFAVDDGNPTIFAETGYPLCIPRSTAVDPLCPESNRPLSGGNIPGTAIPAHLGTFTMDCLVKDTLGACVGAINKPAGFPATMVGTDPRQQAPLEVGDYVVYAGTRAVDAVGPYVSAHTVTANLGIYTTPGLDPAYMVQEVSIVGVGTTNGFAGPAEGRELFKIVGFTTDVGRPVDTGKLVTDPCDGTEAFNRITTQYPNGSTLNTAAAGTVPWGRFRTTFLKGAGLATPMRPAVKEIQTQIQGSNPTNTTSANGLIYGQYTAPVSEYIFAENLGFGGLPIVPNNFEDFTFLALGHGPWDLYDPYGTLFTPATLRPIQGQLSPWPGSPAPAAVNCAGGGSAPPVIVVSDLSVASQTAVTINASASYSLAPGAVLNYSWLQLTGPLEVPVDVAAPSSSTLSFTAPTVTAAPAKVLTFELTVTDIAHAKSSVKVVKVTVNPSAAVDTLTFAATPTYRTKDGSWGVLLTGTNSAAVVSIEASNSAGTVVLTKQAMAHTVGTFAWSFNNKLVVSPLIGNPPPLTIKITSDQGGSLLGSVAVRTN
jgi:hypothetical protein